MYDSATGEPLQGAEVIDRLTGDFALTTQTGTVSLNFVRATGSILEVRKIGYEPSAFIVDPTDTVPITLVLQRAITLAPVLTTAHYDLSKDPGIRSGFDQRCQSKQVSCITPEEISKYPSHTLGDFVLHAPGVTIQACGKAGRRGACGLAMHAANGSGYCTPSYVVDGYEWDTHALGPPIDPPFSNATNRPAPFTTSNVSRIEIYDAQSARPLRFEADPRCGVVVIWTK